MFLKFNIISKTISSIKLFILATIIIFFCACDNKTKEKHIHSSKDTMAIVDSTRLKNKNLTYIQAYNKALTLWQTPFVEKDVKTSFGNAHIIISGPENTKPLILLHGMNASSTMWYPNAKTLSKHYRIYAIDFLLEPGKSQCLGEIKNTDEIVNWYYEIFNQLNLKEINLVGASRGGWLAMNIALHDPSRISKMILLSPAQTFIWIKPNEKTISNITYSIAPKRKKLRNTLETMTHDVDKLDQLYIDQYYIATKEATINKSFFDMTPFSKKQLKSLSIPVLLLIGDTDFINTNKSLRIAKRNLSNLQTYKISNAGHFLSFDQPEVVNKKIIDFLTDNNSTAKK